MAADREPLGEKVQLVLDTLLDDVRRNRYMPGDQIPTQVELMALFNVSRGTVSKAIQELQRRGVLVATRGSGTTVVSLDGAPAELDEGPDGPGVDPTWMTLQSRFEAALEEQERVTIDMASFTNENGTKALLRALEKVRPSKARPQSLQVRVVVTEPSLRLPFPCRADGVEDERLGRRLSSITRRSAINLAAALEQLKWDRRVPEVGWEFRTVPILVSHKTYLLNGTEALTGQYVFRSRPQDFPVPGDADGRTETLEILDVAGSGVRLARHLSRPDGQEQDPGFQGCVLAFETMWKWLAKPSTLGEQ